MPFVVLYDAAVLYPAPLRDLLLRVARTGLVRAHWTEQILDECFRNIIVNRPDLPPAALERTRQLMNQAVPNVLVTGHESLVDVLSLPDPDDRHVLAAAIKAGAQVIVTWNLTDFPATSLAPYGIEAIDPDEFIVNVLDLAPGAMTTVVSEQAAALKNPPITMADLLETLLRQGLVRAVARLRELMGGVGQ
ncbi:MAG TPA: PIN domain-containing protein [Polyangia bacterium]|nr:PIN domain-containing protein [Polyangia bacterium]